MIHPSLYVFSQNPSNQQAKQAEPTNTPTKGSGIIRQGSSQTVFSPNAVDTCFAYTKQRKEGEKEWVEGQKRKGRG